MFLEIIAFFCYNTVESAKMAEYFYKKIFFVRKTYFFTKREGFMNKLSLKLASRLLCHYGFFASLCQATAILFCAKLLTDTTGDVYFHRFFPMLEHSLVSFITVIAGAILLEYIDKKEKKD